jgi:monofunctional biosynthetic peptidoglycan transglycosylase
VLTVATLLIALPPLLVWSVGAFDAPVTVNMMQRQFEGETIYRRVIPLSEMAPSLITAVVIEDGERFCSADLPAPEQALLLPPPSVLDEIVFESDADYFRTSIREASSISEMAVQNVFLGIPAMPPLQQPLYKALNGRLTNFVESIWSKRQTMSIYLNSAYFGQGAVGAESASQILFGKPASALTAEEAATLAVRARHPRHPETWVGAAQIAERVAQPESINVAACVVRLP